MNNAVTLAPSRPSVAPERLESLQHAIEHSAHFLPCQAPIRVFVHHNTLHAFEHLKFADGVKLGAVKFGCEPYLSESRYREKMARRRILPQDLAAVLMEDLGDEADRLISFLSTRYHLRLAMLQNPLRLGADSELRWLLAESHILDHFAAEASPHVREQIIDRTRRWVMRDLRTGKAEGRIAAVARVLFQRFGGSKIEEWDESTWESFILHLLWHACREGVHGVPRFTAKRPAPVRHRDYLLRATGVDSDRLVNEHLIRYCAAFTDQGVAAWTLPTREQGFFHSWLSLYRDSHPVDHWLRDLPHEIRRIESAGLRPLEVIDESLDLLGVAPHEREEYLAQTLLALPGWTGMLWQLETNAEWVLHPAPAGTLLEYTAVRLVLERLALSTCTRDALGQSIDLAELRARLRARASHEEPMSVDQRAFIVFQLAQTFGWLPADLFRMSKEEWTLLVSEIETFSSLERRRIYHLAFERRYRNWLLDATIAHARFAHPMNQRPAFQVLCCIDDREESFRRHLEEVAPDCETFGVAGFYGVAMYYRGAADAHYVPLCPVIIKPRHYVQEEVVYSFEESHRRRSGTRRALGLASHQVHVRSRSIVGGALAAILGSLASIPLVARVLFPLLTARIRRLFGSFVQPPPMTRLLLEREEAEPGPRDGNRGYSLAELVVIAERVLRDMGMTRQFARIVIIVGHGSSSLNNPHNSAYDCGACGGGRGGPNARALASVLSDPRVRERLADAGLEIPRETIFVGAYHNTCDDSVKYFDLDRLPSSHREDFERARDAIEEARRRNAHERCRRFESAELTFSPEAALRHVEARSEDLSQVRPECGHATNACTFVGRRWRTRGLFLDRRAFLTSYDPTQDDENARSSRGFCRPSFQCAPASAWSITSATSTRLAMGAPRSCRTTSFRSSA